MFDGLRALGITAISVESVVPGYLGARARQFQYGRFRAAAREYLPQQRSTGVFLAFAMG